MQGLSKLELELLRAAQDGIEIVPRPYESLAQKLNISEGEVISMLESLEERGIVRRVSATIGHIALGIVANAMIAWVVPLDELDSVGEIVASFDEVTHCYQRDSYPKWPYNLYTMVHSRSREDCQRIAEKISKRCGVQEYIILFSEREFKKTSAMI